MLVLVICRGNVDTEAPPELYPATRLVELSGWRVLLLHAAGMPPKVPEPCLSEIQQHRAEIVVFGHSHKHEVCVHDGVLFINPGSAGMRPCHEPFCMHA